MSAKFNDILDVTYNVADSVAMSYAVESVFYQSFAHLSAEVHQRLYILQNQFHAFIPTEVTANILEKTLIWQKEAILQLYYAVE